MTDWLPWGLAVMLGTQVGERPDLRAATWSLIATAVVCAGIYALYLLFGERWVWYQ